MKLIDKDALLAKIDGEIKLLEPYLGACAGQIVAEANAKLSVLEKLNDFLDTLEVKDVDLDFMLHEYWNLSPKITIDCLESATMTKDEMINFAKHFFELGLAQNNIENDVQKQKERLLSEIEEAVDSIDYYTVDGLLITIKEKIEELKAQKGEEYERISFSCL